MELFESTSGREPSKRSGEKYGEWFLKAALTQGSVVLKEIYTLMFKSSFL